MPKAIHIPIVAAEAAVVPAEHPVHVAPAAPVSRRRFLKDSAVLSGLLAAGSPLALLAPSRAWALELTHVDKPQADAIMALAKTLYPHKTLPDAVYALVVKDIDAKMSDAKTAELVKSGVASLNQGAGSKFTSATDAQRTAIVTAQQADPFVQLVRAQCITSLYNNDMAFAHFGYEGESFSKGGYVNRGFNDLTWLPNPPPDASPSVA
jgi:Gluconate 2-dehydrogenase subunit 3